MKTIDRRSAATPAPEKPLAPEPPLEVDPDPRSIAGRLSCIGTAPPRLAAEQLAAELLAAMPELEGYSPRAQEIRAGLVAARQQKRDWTGKLERLLETRNALREAVFCRADLRSELATAAAKLEAARSTLASADCLSLNDGELARLTAESAHVPAAVEGLKSRIDESTAEVERLLAETGIDGEKFLASLLRAARADRYPDSRTLNLAAAGHLTV
jgi:hypothetical protein